MSRCTECHRQMRPAGTRKADYPGTLHPGARGMCNVCYDKTREFTQTVQPKVEDFEFREVLVRVYLTPSTYKALRQAKVDTSAVLSKFADKLVEEARKRA